MSIMKSLNNIEAVLTMKNNTDFSIVNQAYIEFKSLFPAPATIVGTPMFDAYVEYIYKFKWAYPWFFTTYSDLKDLDLALIVEDPSEFDTVAASLYDLFYSAQAYLPENIFTAGHGIDLSLPENHHIGRFLADWGILLWESGQPLETEKIFNILINMDDSDPFGVKELIPRTLEYTYYSEFLYTSAEGSQKNKEEVTNG